MITPRAENTIIITGGAGFIGSNLAAQFALRRPGARVVVVDNFRSGSVTNLVDAYAIAGAGPFEGEVIPRGVSEIDWPKLVRERGPAAVFHLGAITDTQICDERLVIDENLGAFHARESSSMLRACADNAVPLVYASSAAVYGCPPAAAQRRAFTEGDAGQPRNVYGFSKWLMECEHAKFATAHPAARVVGLRYFNVFGPGEARKGRTASMIGRLAGQLIRGERPRLFHDGFQARDFIPVQDAVEATLAASGLFADAPVPGVYNVGAGQAMTFNTVLTVLRESLDVSEARLPTEFIEMPPAIRAFFQDFTQADMTRAVTGLRWKPGRDVREAIRDYAVWLRGSLNISREISEIGA
ncbi:MAG: NAD-dependent epimerase/dehydratase family protein [Tepidisphaera sp.]|nr:NAD-dependent epimerase/dehydratase family protein [Tepidisphaera sp.]